MLEIAKGRPPPADWNEHLLAFLPKGKEDDDIICGAFRAPSAARAIALKNADCKLVDAATNAKIAQAVEAASPAPQKAFLRGRSFLDHVLAMDVKARACGFQDDKDLLAPVMALFDFGDAFPSLMVDWLVAMLVFSGFEGGFLRALVALYWLSAACVHRRVA